MVWIPMGVIPITQFNTWIIFPTPLPLDINVFRFRAVTRSNINLGSLYARFWFFYEDCYTEEWETIYPKPEWQVFRFEPNNQVFLQKKLAVVRYSNRYNSSSEVYALSFEYWHEKYLPSVSIDEKLLEDVANLLSDQITTVEETILNLSVESSNNLSQLELKNQAILTAVVQLLKDSGGENAENLANDLLAENQLLNYYFL